MVAVRRITPWRSSRTTALPTRDLTTAVVLLEKVLQHHPGFQNERIATFSCNSVTLVFAAASDDTSARAGFETDDCPRDFKAVVERDAVVLEPPTDKACGNSFVGTRAPPFLLNESPA
jgi:hypothetical protein